MTSIQAAHAQPAQTNRQQLLLGGLCLVKEAAEVTICWELQQLSEVEITRTATRQAAGVMILLLLLAWGLCGCVMRPLLMSCCVQVVACVRLLADDECLLRVGCVWVCCMLCLLLCRPAGGPVPECNQRNMARRPMSILALHPACLFLTVGTAEVVAKTERTHERMRGKSASW